MIMRLALLFVFIVLFLGFLTLVWNGDYSHKVRQHQTEQRRSYDSTSLRVMKDCYFSNTGIIIIVFSTSEISKIYRQSSWKSIINPFVEVNFKAFKNASPNQYYVLCPYDFKADSEFYLEVFNRTGNWCSISPYFPMKPNVTDSVWDDLWKRDNGTLLSDDEVNQFESSDPPDIT